MKTARKTLCFALCVIPASLGLRAMADPALAGRTPQEIFAEMGIDQTKVNDLLGKDNAALKTPVERSAAAPKLLPLVHRMSNDLGELAVAVPQLKEQIAGSQLQMLSLLSVLGEDSATDQIKVMSASKDPAQALAGKAHEIMARFYVAENSAASQTSLVDDLEKLDRAYPDSVLLTQMSIEIGHEESEPELRKRVLNIAAVEMNNPVATRLKAQLETEKAAADQDALVANKPLTLGGTLPDGKPFSTKDLKGKVILIDFWATWCGPCKAELPHVKKIYEQYHDKGLEIVGVSNDYDLDALKTFVQAANMPWPELFDADAAAKQKWNLLTSGQNITGIPVMYLIDRKGILRTVNARENMDELIPKLLAEHE